MVLDALRVRWQDQNATRNGRRGQRQNGVDIWGSNATGVVGAQVKNREKISEADALTEIAKAENFRPTLKEYFFAIGGSRDSNFQEFLRILSARRVVEGLFPVYVIFFEDVTFELATHRELVAKYWGQFFTDLASALTTELNGPLLYPEMVVSQIAKLEQYKVMLEYMNALPESNRRLSLTIEAAPNLCALEGDIDRFWRVALGESSPERTVITKRVAISLSGNDVRIWRGSDNTWLTVEDWKSYENYLRSIKKRN
jgi:hypothetical protein